MKFVARCLDIVGKVWASPCSLIGLMWVAVGYVGYLLFSGYVKKPIFLVRNNALNMLYHPLMPAHSAICLGNVVCYGSKAKPWKGGSYGYWNANYGLHEEAHTYQYQLFGIFFFPIYGISAFFIWALGMPNHWMWLEAAAQRYAKRQGGWLL